MSHSEKQIQQSTAILLAGGRGARLRPYNLVLPKPLIPVGEKPVLAHLLTQLVKFNFNDLRVCLGQYGNLIRAASTQWGLPEGTVEFFQETKPLGTIGSLSTLTGSLPENFLVSNADVLTDLDFRQLFQFHIQSNSKVTLASTIKKVSIPYGVVGLVGGTRLRSFTEKPTQELLINTGIYVFHRDIIQLIPEGTPYGVDDLVRCAIQAKLEVNNYVHDGSWWDVGDPAFPGIGLDNTTPPLATTNGSCAAIRMDRSQNDNGTWPT